MRTRNLQYKLRRAARREKRADRLIDYYESKTQEPNTFNKYMRKKRSRTSHILFQLKHQQ